MDDPHYTLVFRALAAACFHRNAGLRVPFVEGDRPAFAVEFQTVFKDMNLEAPVPHFLQIQIEGAAKSLEDAIDKYSMLVGQFAFLVALVANAPVDELELFLAYDSTPDVEQREFVQVQRPGDPSPPPVRNRVVDRALLTRLITTPPPPELDRDSSVRRLHHALRHYNHALANWYYGGEALVTNHLWIAAEALDELFVRRASSTEQRTVQELAADRNIDLDSPNWKNHLRGWYRQHSIFQGDSKTYAAAQAARVGLVHAVAQEPDIQQNARDAADKSLVYVRGAFLDILGIRDPERSALEALRPLDVKSMKEVARGTFEKVHDPTETRTAPLEWHSVIAQCTRLETQYVLKFQSRPAIAGAENVNSKFAIVGRFDERDEVRVDIDSKPI